MATKLEPYAKKLAADFSVTDWVGLIGGILEAFQSCKETRNGTTDEMRANIKNGPLARITMRRALRQNMDERVGLRKLNQIADRIIEDAQSAGEEKLELVFQELDEFPNT